MSDYGVYMLDYVGLLGVRVELLSVHVGLLSVHVGLPSERVGLLTSCTCWIRQYSVYAFSITEYTTHMSCLWLYTYHPPTVNLLI